MTHDEIIEMAQECNLIGMRPHLDGIYSEALIAFANLVAAKEREACEHKQDTTPPQRSESSGKPAAWVGLTNDELTDLFYNTNLGQQSAVAQAIALLKERNT